jgi:hypothetical protein
LRDIVVDMVVRRRFLSASLSFALAAASFPTVARAQTDDERAGARAAADAGLQAYGAKNWASCKDYFTRAQSLIDAPPHLLYIARCSVQLGQLVSAREAYLKIRRAPVAADKPQAFQDAKASAETELAALEPRIPYLNVTVTGGTGGPVSVKMDGVEIPSALVGIPHPVDPGTHKLEASTSGMTAAAKSVTVREGQHQDLTLELTANTAGAPPPVAPTGPAPTDPSTTPGPSPTAPSSGDAAPGAETGSTGGAPLRTIGFVTMGVGVAGLVVGGIFLAKSGSDSSNATSDFNQFNCAKSCTPDQQQQVKDLDSQSTSAKTVAFVTGGVGVVALGVGLALVLWPHQDAAPAPQGVTVTPVIGLGALGLHGSF